MTERTERTERIVFSVHWRAPSLPDWRLYMDRKPRQHDTVEAATAMMEWARARHQPTLEWCVFKRTTTVVTEKL